MRAEYEYVSEAIGTARAGESSTARVKRTFKALKEFLRDHNFHDMRSEVVWLEDHVQSKGRP